MVNSCSCCDKTAVKKGVWTPEEDMKLIAYVSRYGHWNWRQLPRFAGLSRCGKSCRLRWMNYLRPNIRRGNYTREEEETIIRLYKEKGGRWSAMAAQLPGRTDNDIKNHWNTVLKRRVLIKQQKKPMAKEPAKTSSTHDVSGNEYLIPNGVAGGVIEQQENYSTFIDLATLETALESFEPVPPVIQTSVTKDYAAVSSNINMSVDDHFKPTSSQVELQEAASAESRGDFWTDPFWLELDCFVFPFDDRQPFGESNVFSLLDEFLWQEGIY